MKHLKTYEAFSKNDFKVDDIVKVLYDGKEYVAKISKINTKFSYIVNIREMGRFINKPIEIKSKNILQMVKPAEEPAMGSSWVTSQGQKISNDMVINGYPDVPLANPMSYSGAPTSINQLPG